MTNEEKEIRRKAVAVDVLVNRMTWREVGKKYGISSGAISYMLSFFPEMREKFPMSNKGAPPKFSEAEQRHIVESYTEGGLTIRNIAKLNGTTAMTISKVLNMAKVVTADRAIHPRQKMIADHLINDPTATYKSVQKRFDIPQHTIKRIEKKYSVGGKRKRIDNRTQLVRAKAVKILREHEMTLEDVALVIGVTRQRAHQLAQKTG